MHYIPVEMDSGSSSIFDSQTPPPWMHSRIVRLGSEKDLAHSLALILILTMAKG